MITVFLFLTITVTSYLGVEIFRRWTLRREFFDIPNERSSHTTPTPRGAGLVIAVICLTAYSIYIYLGNGTFDLAYVLGALLIAGISWADDLRTVPSVWRFGAHTVAALIVMPSIGSFEQIYVPIVQETITSKTVGFMITWFWIVGLTNAYNFMDGIDGIAGGQTIAAGIGWYFVGSALGVDSTSFYGGVIACAGLGFTIQNWQPAKIFMGDVGSAFLGYTFAVLPLLAAREITAAAEYKTLLLPAAVFLLWLFIFDALYTFSRRLLNKEKVWEAHRGHIFQKLVISGLSHQAVAGLYGILSLCNVLVIILLLNYAAQTGPKVGELVLITLAVAEAAFLLIYSHQRSKKTDEATAN